jgi:hypothetical protein
MELNYKLRFGTESVFRLTDGFIIGPPDFPTKADWDEYQAWLAAGNTPEPADVDPYDVTVQMWQLQTIVAKDSLTADVLTAIEDAGGMDLSNPYFSLWEKGISTQRQGQFATLLRDKLKLSDEQLDDIFRRAADLDTLPPL